MTKVMRSLMSAGLVLLFAFTAWGCGEEQSALSPEQVADTAGLVLNVNGDSDMLVPVNPDCD